jgi:hypothetical protein
MSDYATYKPYPLVGCHHDKCFSTGFRMALCDDDFAQVTEFTTNRYFIIEAMRMIKLGMRKNPYAGKMLGQEPLSIGTWSVFKGCKLPKDGLFRLVMMQPNGTQTLFGRHMKRSLFYLNSACSLMGLEETKCGVLLDEFYNYFFFTMDERWCSNPILMDLCLHWINAGTSFLVGNTVYKLLDDASTIQSQKPCACLQNLVNYKELVIQLMENHRTVFSGKQDFWNSKFGTSLFTYQFNFPRLASSTRLASSRGKAKLTNATLPAILAEGI